MLTYDGKVIVVGAKQKKMPLTCANRAATLLPFVLCLCFGVYVYFQYLYVEWGSTRRCGTAAAAHRDTAGKFCAHCVCCLFLLLQGTLKGYDQTNNLVLENCHERVYSTSEGVEQIVLGLYIMRGDSMYACRAFLAIPLCSHLL